MKLIRFIFTLVFLLILLTVNISCKRQATNPGSQSGMQKPPEVSAIILQPQPIEDKILSTGTVMANEEVEIRSEVAGRIVLINFGEGKHVRKGDLLVKINDDELQAQLKKLLLDEKLAKDDVFRKEKLLEMKAVSQEEYDISVNSLGVIQAQVELVRSQLDKTSIYAPFSGQIGLRYVSPGGYISSSMLIARIQETNPVKVEFSVPEKYISKINTGTEVKFTVDGIDSTFTGKVYALEPRINPDTRAAAVRAKCSNPGNLLIPGAFAKVEIILEEIPDALVVPSEVLIPDIKGQKVFTCKSGKVKSFYVTTGIRTEYSVQITGELNPGDTVITTGLLQLREEMPVKVRIQ